MACWSSPVTSPVCKAELRYRLDVTCFTSKQQRCARAPSPTMQISAHSSEAHRVSAHVPRGAGPPSRRSRLGEICNSVGSDHHENFLRSDGGAMTRRSAGFCSQTRPGASVQLGCLHAARVGGISQRGWGRQATPRSNGRDMCRTDAAGLVWILSGWYGAGRDGKYLDWNFSWPHVAMEI